MDSKKDPKTKKTTTPDKRVKLLTDGRLTPSQIDTLEKAFVNVRVECRNMDSDHAFSRAARDCAAQDLEHHASRNPGAVQFQYSPHGRPESVAAGFRTALNWQDGGISLNPRTREQFESGSYSACYMLDVPLTPQSAYEILQYVDSIWLYVIVAGKFHEKICDQQYVWGVGNKYHVTTGAAGSFVEDDLFWLLSGRAVRCDWVGTGDEFIVPDLKAIYKGTGYRKYRITRSKTFHETTRHVTVQQLAIHLRPDTNSRGTFVVDGRPIDLHDDFVHVRQLGVHPGGVSCLKEDLLRALATHASRPQVQEQRARANLVDNHRFRSGDAELPSFGESGLIASYLCPVPAAELTWLGGWWSHDVWQSLRAEASTSGVVPWALRVYHNPIRWLYFTIAFVFSLYLLSSFAPYMCVPQVWSWGFLQVPRIGFDSTFPFLHYAADVCGFVFLGISWNFARSVVLGVVITFLFLGVRTVDAYTVVVHHESPWFWLLLAITMARIFGLRRVVQLARRVWFIPLALLIVEVRAGETELIVLGLASPLLVILFVFACVSRCPAAVHDHPIQHEHDADPCTDFTYSGPLPPRIGLRGVQSLCPLKPARTGKGLGYFGNIMKPGIRIKDDPRLYDHDMVWAVGLVTQRAVQVHYQSQHNAVLAINNRQNTPVIEPDLYRWHELTGRAAVTVVAHALKQHVIPAAVWFADADNVFSVERWVAHFDGAKRRMYEEALSELRQTGWVNWTISVMVKVETIFKREFSDPRCVSMRHPSVPLSFAAIYATFSHRFKHVFGTGGNVLCATGITTAQLNEWFNRPFDDTCTLPGSPGVSYKIVVSGDDQLIIFQYLCFRYVIAVDGSRHDSQMVERFLRLEHEVFYGLMEEWLDDLFEPEEVVAMEEAFGRQFGVEPAVYRKGRSKLLLANLAVSRKSGDLNTSNGNSSIVIVLAVAVVHALALSGVSQFAGKPETEGRIQHIVSCALSDLGYKATVAVADFHESHKYDFLSGLFVPVEGGYAWIPKPGRQIAKLGWSVKRPKRDWWKDTYSRVAGYETWLWVPFFGVLLNRVYELIPDRYRTGAPAKRWGVEFSPNDPHIANEATYAFFEERYGLTRADESKLAQALACVTSLPWMLESSVIDALTEVDL